MRPESVHIDHEVTVAELMADAGPGLGFSTHDLIQQLSMCDDVGEPFFLQQGTELYMVPAADVKAFFVDHAKPKAAMSKEEENKLLKTRLKQMEDEILRLKGQEIKQPKAEPVPVVAAEPQEEGLEPDPLPLPNEPKMSVTQVQDMLSDDLRGKEPYSPSEPAKRGRPKKIL